MEYTLSVDRRQMDSNIFVACIIFCMSILLHQSNEIFGINISFSDIFCFIMLIYFAYHNKLFIPLTSIAFFLLISIIVLLTASIYVPYQFMIFPDFMSIFSNYLKLVATFSYFVIGYNLAKFNHLDATLRWYSFAGIIVGALGVIFTFFNISFFSSLLFYGEIRYRGLMIDPNYFAVLQITAIVFISRSKTIKSKYKWLAGFITVLSVLISGSKTGIITLFSYLMFRLVEFEFLSKKKISTMISHLFVIGCLIASAPFEYYLFQLLMNEVAEYVPAFSRVETLLTDFNGAISENGSSRAATWNVALQIILTSPLIGIGIGTYPNMAFEIYNMDDIAHNTFLQLSAEWGIPLAFIFFTYVFIILVRATFTRTHNTEITLILRDIIIILLLGSLAITLSNARGLWLFLGALIYTLTNVKKEGNHITGGKHGINS